MIENKSDSKIQTPRIIAKIVKTLYLNAEDVKDFIESAQNEWEQIKEIYSIRK